MENNIRYRIFWTWDYCTRWDHSYYVRGRGAFGPNQRRTHFLEDYCRMVDFAANHGINGIVIWGALRAHDNGEKQLKTLIGYGRKKGVRILPGAGIFSYGGVYYDTRRDFNGWIDIPATQYNEYSLHSWLVRHPEYRAVGRDGVPYATGMYSDVACPSEGENLEWFKRALEWLLTDVGADGVQVEIGDYMVCYCDRCEKRRAHSVGDAVFAAEDMAEPYLAACEVAGRVKKDAWVICETYSSFAKKTERDIYGAFGATFDEGQKKMFSRLPGNAVLQWAMDRAVGFRPVHEWDKDVWLPHENNIARIHAGSQHGLNSSEEWAIHPIGDLVKKVRQSGVNGVSIFGEESPVSPPNEANYLVFSEFCGYGNPNPECDMPLFYSQTLDPLYGGSGYAKEWERLYVTGYTARLNRAIMGAGKDPLSFRPAHLAIGDDSLVEKVCAMTPSERRSLAEGLAREAHDISSKLSGEPCRRWSWLENWLWRSEYLHATHIDVGV